MWFEGQLSGESEGVQIEGINFKNKSNGKNSIKHLLKSRSINSKQIEGLIESWISFF